MIKLEDIKAMGPEYAAARLYSEGMGQESNPYPEGTKQREDFALEMGRLQHQDLRELMGWNHA